MNAGQNRITRASTDSAITIPYERTFRDVDTNRPAANTPQLEQFNFCGCGWPQHMLIPSNFLKLEYIKLYTLVTLCIL